MDFGSSTVEVTGHAMGEPRAGSVLPAAMAVMAFGPTVGTPSDVDDDVTPTLPR